jgi:amino acid transporter
MQLIINIKQMKKNNYVSFLAMLVVSFFIMYAVMFFNVSSSDHIYLSTTRLYMTFLMVSPMAISMILFMRKKMYKNKNTNLAIITIASAVFVSSLILLRTQFPVGDSQYMKAMIPHHSSAILTSQEADLEDPELRELADQIIETQIKEIEQMKEILKKLDD